MKFSFSIERELPLPNGNVNGLGVIIRDSEGKMVWGGMGPVPNSGFLITQLKDIHVAAVKALQLGKLKTHIEIDSLAVFESIRDQDEIIFEEETEKLLRQLNTLHANHFEIGVSNRKVSCIIPEMNTVATFLAEFGMENLSAFSEIYDTFGNLQRLLDEDMGLGIHISMPNIQTYLGLGEVIDASPPPSPSHTAAPYQQDDLRMAQDSSDININLNLNVNLDSGKLSEVLSNSKSEEEFGEKFIIPNEKGKILDGYKFNNNGLFSKEALEYLDSGSLSFIAEGFKKDKINLEEKVCEGVFIKDVLESAVCRTLDKLVKKIAEIRISSKGVVIGTAKQAEVHIDQKDDMDVEHAMLDMNSSDVAMQESI